MFATRPLITRSIGVSASGSPLFGRKTISTANAKTKFDAPHTSKSPCLINKRSRPTDVHTKTFRRLSASMTSPHLIDKRSRRADAHHKSFRQLSASMTSRDYELAFNEPRIIDSKRISTDHSAAYAARGRLCKWKFREGVQTLFQPPPERAQNQGPRCPQFAKALGDWGEDELAFILDLEACCGIIENVFKEPVGKAKKRPDFIVPFGTGAKLILDSKAFGSHHGERTRGNYVEYVQFRIYDLHEKKYPSRFPESGCFPFTILFVPRDADLKLAFDQNCSDDKNLQEHAWDLNILLATPTTLPLILARFSTVAPSDTGKINEIVSFIFALTDSGWEGYTRNSRPKLSPVKKLPKFVRK